jgi:UDP-4-amino-4,6-dideoxy-N-acetyl-beta-L-altrosamine transaminase
MLNKYLSYGKQKISEDDVKAVVNTLKSNFLTSGPKVNEFEEKFKNFVGSKYSVCCTNGTSALHIAFKAINLVSGDNIILPSINFIAAANMAKNLGAKIFLADVDPLTGQMTPENLLECVKKNNIKKVKAICTMYNGGLPLNAEKFFKIKKKLKCYLIEDACHALGGKYSLQKNIKVGSCKFSDISIFSFHPLKSITSGEGGMLTTNNIKFKNFAEKFRNHGIEKKIKKNKNNWSYEIVHTGFNYRLTDIQCALGISQLKKLNNFIYKRNKIAKIYNNLFKKNHLIIKNTNKNNQDIKSAWHLYIININFKKLNISKEKFIQILHSKNIGVQIHYIPTFLQPNFKNLKKNKVKFKGAKSFFKSALSLPIYQSLNEREVKEIAKIINNILNNNVKK